MDSLTLRSILLPVLTERSPCMDPVLCLLFMTVKIKRTVVNQAPDVCFVSRRFTGFPSCTRHFTTLYCNSHLRSTFPFSLLSTRQVTEETPMRFSKRCQWPADPLDQPLVAQIVNNYPGTGISWPCSHQSALGILPRTKITQSASTSHIF